MVYFAAFIRIVGYMMVEKGGSSFCFFSLGFVGKNGHWVERKQKKCFLFGIQLFLFYLCKANKNY